MARITPPTLRAARAHLRGGQREHAAAHHDHERAHGGRAASVGHVRPPSFTTLMTLVCCVCTCHPMMRRALFTGPSVGVTQPMLKSWRHPKTNRTLLHYACEKVGRDPQYACPSPSSVRENGDPKAQIQSQTNKLVGAVLGIYVSRNLNNDRPASNLQPRRLGCCSVLMKYRIQYADDETSILSSCNMAVGRVDDGIMLAASFTALQTLVC